MNHIGFLADPTSGELRIGASIVFASGFVAVVLDQLSHRYPRIAFHVFAAETGLTYRAVAQLFIDTAREVATPLGK